MFWSNSNDPLAFILAGFEHSGTTLISEILRQHPNLDGAFEGGLLLTKKLKDFVDLEPFASNFKSGWKVTDEQLRDICASKNYAEAYGKIQQYSDVIENKGSKIFDKTPRYMQRLSTVLNKLSGLKAVVMVRDMRSLMDSTASRSGLGIDEWIETVYPITRRHTMSYLDGLTVALNDTKLRKQVYVLRYEELILDQEKLSREMFKFLGYEFKPEYLEFQSVRYSKNVYGNSIKTDFITKYKKNLPEDFLNQVVADFSQFSDYFWES